ncbi:MAG: DNA-directed RNA polymerase subunit G [Thermoproteales archaeon]|nr:DNA-directed RNA polymerase subunit G [Thermoproteales archaeon]RLE65850.1 MAG: hypothetical protein DRJ47_03730 [Thermoprotei archaeon]
MFEVKFSIERSEPSPLPEVTIFYLRSEKGDIEASLDMAERILNDLGETWNKGDTLVIRLETSEAEKFYENEVYATGRVYHKESNGNIKYFISIGGFQLIITSGKEVPFLEEALNSGRKIYISIRRIK